MVKNLLAMRKTQVQSLDWEDSLEKEMATHFSILAWRNSMDRGAWQATVHGVSKSWTQQSDFTSLHFTSETANSPPRRQQFCIQILVLNSPRISLCEPTSAIQAKEDALRFPPAGSYLVKGQNTVASSLPLPHQILLALLYFSKVIL